VAQGPLHLLTAFNQSSLLRPADLQQVSVRGCEPPARELRRPVNSGNRVVDYQVMSNAIAKLDAPTILNILPRCAGKPAVGLMAGTTLSGLSMATKQR
jgi:hypothetical protein